MTADSSWKTTENLCMLSAMYNIMNDEQRNLLTVRNIYIYLTQKISDLYSDIYQIL